MSQQRSQVHPNGEEVVTFANDVTEEEAAAAMQVLQHIKDTFPQLNNSNDVSLVKGMSWIIIHLQFIFSLSCIYYVIVYFLGSASLLS